MLSVQLGGTSAHTNLETISRPFPAPSPSCRQYIPHPSRVIPVIILAPLIGFDCPELHGSGMMLCVLFSDWLSPSIVSVMLLLWQYLILLFPWRRKWQTTPGSLPGKSHGQRSLAGYSPWFARVGHGNRGTTTSSFSL